MAISSSSVYSESLFRLRSCSLTMSNHINFFILLKHSHSDLLNHSSISLRPFHDSQPYTSTERAMVLNNFSFVRKDIPISSQTRSMFLKAAPALSILVTTSFLIFPFFRTLHPTYTNFSTFWMVSFSITT